MICLSVRSLHRSVISWSGDCCVVSSAQDDQLSVGSVDTRQPPGLHGTQKIKVRCRNVYCHCACDRICKNA